MTCCGSSSIFSVSLFDFRTQHNPLNVIRHFENGMSRSIVKPFDENIPLPLSNDDMIGCSNSSVNVIINQFIFKHFRFLALNEFTWFCQNCTVLEFQSKICIVYFRVIGEFYKQRFSCLIAPPKLFVIKMKIYLVSIFDDTILTNVQRDIATSFS